MFAALETTSKLYCFVGVSHFSAIFTGRFGKKILTICRNLVPWP